MLVDALFNAAFCLLYPDYVEKQKNIYESILENNTILRGIDNLDCCKDSLSVAIEFLNMGVDEDSTNFCFLFMGLAYKELDIEKAYSIFEYLAYNNEKIDLRSKVWVLRNLARIEAYEDFDVKRSLEYFEEVLCIDDTYYFDYFQIAQLKEVSGFSREEIEVSYNQMILCDPNNIDAYLLRAKSLEDFQKVIDLGRNNADVYCARARYKEKSNDLLGALADYDIAVATEPHNSLIYRNRADFKERKLNNIEAAISDYNYAIQYSSDDSLLFRNRAFLKIKKKEFTGALEDLDIAIRLAPLSEDLYAYKAVLYEKIASWNHALDCYNMMVVIDPHNRYTYLKRAKVFKKLHRYVEASNDIKMSNSLKDCKK